MIKGAAVIRLPADIGFSTDLETKLIGRVRHLHDEFIVAGDRHPAADMVTEIDQLFNAALERAETS